MSTMDGRDHAVYSNDVFVVGPHRKAVSDETYISVPKKEIEEQFPTFMDVMEKGGAYGLAALFDSVAASTGERSDIFWLINVTDDRVTEVNNTHAQGSYPHVHIVSGSLSDGFEQIASEKTFTPNPKEDFNKGFDNRKTVFTKLETVGRFDVYEVPEEYAESERHVIVTAENFADFKDFVKNAGREDLYVLNGLLQKYLGEEIPKGGARLISDDKFHPTGAFTLRIQGGDQRQRWFQSTSPS